VNHTWQLNNALKVVRAGDMIELSPGTYDARINIYNAIGSVHRPITICGPQSAVIAGKPNYDKNSFALTLVNSTYTRLVGFSVQYGLTGVMMENTTYSMVVGLTINNTRNEGIRLRYGSKYNTIRNNKISLTGRRELGGWGGTGEGIYVGSSQKQMHSYGRYWLDRSDYNVLEYNVIGPGVLSEMIDVKEGTTGGIIRGNLFDGRHLTNLNGANSWLSIKGNNWTVTNNNGQYLKNGHGMGTSRKLSGWGRYNTFKDNNCLLYRFGSKSSAGSYCVFANTVPESQIIDCSNVAIGATKGVTNVRSCPGDAQLSGKKRRMRRRALMEGTSEATVTTTFHDEDEEEVFWTHHIDEPY
jgi:parallel beta-helix repeat protein